MNICVSTYSLSRGNGVDVSVAEFAGELARSHNVKIVAACSEMTVPGVEILNRSVRGPGKMHQLARELDSQKFDFISTHISPMDIVASMTGIPHLLHDPGVIPARLIGNGADLYNWSLVNGCRLLSARKIAMALPISDYLGREFRKKYLYRGKMSTLPYGIDFSGADVEPAGDYGKYILFVGKHRHYKGVHELIRIFADVKKEMGDSVHLVTIGTPENKSYGDTLSAMAKKVGNVHMLGYVKDIWPYYAGASAYATCSRWEGQDRPVIEAQYLGKPAVSFDNCSHPETVVYGSLARDDREFKEALCKYLSADKTDLSVRPKIVERFSTGSMVSQFIKIIKSMDQV